MVKIYILNQEMMKYLHTYHPNVAMWILNSNELKIEEKKLINTSRVINKKDRYEILKRQNWRCNQCGCALKYNKGSKWGGEIAHIDHIFPYSKRKTYPRGIENINELSNLQALCPNCNLSKSKKEIQ
jgi:5-methylcytosine-specific restriction endonuclease McrA